MTASNLGIIFGPTLVKPQQTDAEVSLSSLVDYPYQVLMVELLVRHFHLIFDASPLPGSETAAQASPRLTPQEKAQQLSKHSTSLTDMKEVRTDPVYLYLLVYLHQTVFDIYDWGCSPLQTVFVFALTGLALGGSFNVQIVTNEVRESLLSNMKTLNPPLMKSHSSSADIISCH